VFPGDPPPWTTNAVQMFTGFFWAPDIAYFNGRYNLYYSCSRFGTIDSAIGLVTTPSLNSPTWTDQGKVIQSDAVSEAGPDTDLTSFNCIDPSILMDTNGTIWMSFGSYSDGILVMQLDPITGKRVDTNTPPVKIADNGPTFFSNTTEGSCLHQRGGYYYLFLNFGGCCVGVNSTYNIRVGRSQSVTGPYLDRNGVNMLDFHRERHELVHVPLLRRQQQRRREARPGAPRMVRGRLAGIDQ
jgi:arabinan endo-1,5-alpha-L-arabinosidase